MWIEFVLVLALASAGAYLFVHSLVFRSNVQQILSYAGFDSMSLFMGTAPTMATLRLGLERELTRLARIQQNLTWGTSFPRVSKKGESEIQTLLEDFIDKRFAFQNFSNEELRILEIASFAEQLSEYYKNEEKLSKRLSSFSEDLRTWRRLVHWFAMQTWDDPFPAILRTRTNTPSQQ